MLEIKFDNMAGYDAAIFLTGDLNSTTVASFNERVLPMMDDAGKKVRLDLASLEFISSAGLRSLLLLKKTLASKGGSLEVVNIQPPIRKVFDLTGFTRLLEIA